MRAVSIYAIRVGDGPFLYVGASTDISRRRRVRYSPALEEAAPRESREYVVLETTDLERAQAREDHWISELRRLGHPLLNKSRSGGIATTLAVTPPSYGKARTKQQLRDAGIRRIEVELDAETHRRLLWLVEDSGYSRADVVRSLIDVEYEESQSTKKNGPTA